MRPETPGTIGWRSWPCGSNPSMETAGARPDGVARPPAPDAGGIAPHLRPVATASGRRCATSLLAVARSLRRDLSAGLIHVANPRSDAHSPTAPPSAASVSPSRARANTGRRRLLRSERM
jgi:hypothetical protein